VVPTTSEVSGHSNEVRAMGKLATGAHENIIKIFGFGELQNSTYHYIDMELCDFDLKEYIDNRHQFESQSRVLGAFMDQGEKHSVDVWNIMRQIANGVAFIHSHREVHRDLKPRNGMSSKNVLSR
jgi:serine/threonine protein kinase